MKFKDLVCFIVFTTAVIFTAYVYAGFLNENMVVSNAWVQAMPPSQTTTAAYMVIENNSPKEEILISAFSEMAGAAEIHQMSDMNGMMHMAMMPNVRIPAMGKVTLKPGGVHIMLINLKKPVNKGDIIPITLHFQDGGSIMVNADVRDQ